MARRNLLVSSPVNEDLTNMGKLVQVEAELMSPTASVNVDDQRSRSLLRSIHTMANSLPRKLSALNLSGFATPFAEGPGGVTPRRVTGQRRPRMVIEFTAGDGPVVTSETCAWHHPRVTELRPRKGRRRSVTQFAGCCCWDVCGRLAPRRRAVMAGGAPRHDPRVIKRGALGTSWWTYGTSRRVASSDVCGRLAPRRRAVMAGGAPRDDPCVIKRGAQERRGGLMACLAGLRRRDVCGRLAQGCCAVMAGGAPRATIPV